MKQQAEKDPVTLDSLKSGDRGLVIKLTARGPFKKRLLEMGFVAGAEVTVVKYAPLMDPVEYSLKGYHVSLRHEEAAHVLIERL